jgi:plastocyanin
MRKTSSIAVLVIAVVAGLVLAGCSQSAGTTTTAPGTTTTAPGTTTTGGATTTAGAGQFQVAIANFAFSPAELTVPVGSKVTWTNNQATNHTVTSDTGAFGSPTLAQGDTFEFTFTQAGQFPYHCSIHTTMTATIIVTG